MQNLIEFLLGHNSNLFNHLCCQVIQYVQFNVRSGTNVVDNQSDNHGVDTNTNEKSNIQTTFYKNNDKRTVHRDNDDDSNLIKRQSENMSGAKKQVLIIDDSMIKYVNGQEVSRNNSVKVRSRPAAATDDFIDYVRKTVGRKPNLVLIHARTNDSRKI